MEIQGKIYRIFETQQINQTFRKREFIIEYSENSPQYIQYVKFEAIQDKCIDLDHLKEGDFVEISFNIKGRRWINPQNQEVFFNSLEAWRIVKKNQNTPDSEQPQNIASPSHSNFPHDNTHTEIEGTDDIPF